MCRCGIIQILVECIYLNNKINNIRAKMDSKERKSKKGKNEEEIWKKEKEEIDKRISKNSKQAQNQIKNISQIDKDVYYLVNK